MSCTLQPQSVDELMQESNRYTHSAIQDRVSTALREVPTKLFTFRCPNYHCI